MAGNTRGGQGQATTLSRPYVVRRVMKQHRPRSCTRNEAHPAPIGQGSFPGVVAGGFARAERVRQQLRQHAVRRGRAQGAVGPEHRGGLQRLRHRSGRPAARDRRPDQRGVRRLRHPAGQRLPAVVQQPAPSADPADPATPDAGRRRRCRCPGETPGGRATGIVAGDREGLPVRRAGQIGQGRRPR